MVFFHCDKSRNKSCATVGKGPLAMRIRLYSMGQKQKVVFPPHPQKNVLRHDILGDLGA